MAKYKLEYIWLDGYTPVPNLRSKTQIKEFSSFPKLEELPMWGFDGSSTRQAEGRSSDCMLK
ncbi:MAG: glutamine synthetase, partial [Verrucomicrobia bacterium]|nr:glutamine synthetase [Verrucomicrobiota bacterium]